MHSVKYILLYRVTDEESENSRERLSNLSRSHSESRWSWDWNPGCLTSESGLLATLSLDICTFICSLIHQMFIK